MRPDCSPYEAGDYEGFCTASTPSTSEISSEIWIVRLPDGFVARPTPARDRRRVVAASVALKLHPPRSLARGTAPRGMGLFAAAQRIHRRPAAVLRLPPRISSGSSPRSRLSRGLSITFLVGVPPTLNRDPDPGRGRTRNHLAHAIAALPDEPRLFLAFATAAEFASWGSDSPDPVWIDGERIEQAEPLAPDIRTDARTARALTRRQTDRICRGRESDTLWSLPTSSAAQAGAVRVCAPRG